MTRIRAFLEDFGAPRRDQEPVLAKASVAELETTKLEAFETGYRAGWDDAIKAQTEDQSRISSDFAQNLQDLSFTYHEAYRQVMNGMSPLLEEIVSALMPKVLAESLGLHVIEHLQRMAAEIGTLDVVISVAPGSAASVLPLLDRDFGFPLQIQEDPSLAEGQADIRFAEIERQVDLSGLAQDIAQAVHGFAQENRRKIAHG